MRFATACLLAGTVATHAIDRLGSVHVDEYKTFKPINTENVCTVYTADDMFMTGTLIHPNVVLTSSHFTGDPTHVTFGDREVKVTRYLKHEDHNTTFIDLALLYIETVDDIKPATLVDTQSINSTSLNGEHVYIVGVGDMCSGSSSSRVFENVERRPLCATNIIDRASGMAYWCDFDGYDPNKNLSGLPGPTSMEGMIAPGDSGGPMFLQSTGELIGIARDGSKRNRSWVYDAGRWVTLVDHIDTFIIPNLPIDSPWEPVISRDFDPTTLNKPVIELPSSPEDLVRIQELEQQVTQQQDNIDALQQAYDTQSVELEQVTIESQSYYDRLYFPLLVGWRYSPDHGWLYTDTDVFPYIYRSDNDTWYFFARELQTGDNGRAFFNYTTNEWELWK